MPDNKLSNNYDFLNAMDSGEGPHPDDGLQGMSFNLRKLRMADTQADVESAQMTVTRPFIPYTASPYATPNYSYNTKQETDIGMDVGSSSNDEVTPPATTEGFSIPGRNIQHLLHRRERRVLRHEASSTAPSFYSAPSYAVAEPAVPPPRPDYAARNRELQARPRRNHYIRRSGATGPFVLRFRVPRQPRATYISVMAEMTSQIIDDLVERPTDIEHSLKKFLRWYKSRFPLDDESWHQYKAEWAVWMRYYKGHPKRDYFIGVEPNLPRAYTKAQRTTIYEDSKLGSLMKKIGI